MSPPWGVKHIINCENPVFFISGGDEHETVTPYCLGPGRRWGPGVCPPGCLTGFAGGRDTCQRPGRYQYGGGGGCGLRRRNKIGLSLPDSGGSVLGPSLGFSLPPHGINRRGKDHDDFETFDQKKEIGGT